ncbi:Clp protease N-terminal domain-containing protein [Plantactinospora sp. GCM10030261]|uniref:Clp protease N-terminal domain-containing protein n=1 Tax=Plantactinospora sp. GCM10030261 TaxID=3273420 RepID=UPI003619A5FE
MPSWFDFVTVEARTVLLAAGVTARHDGRTEISADDVALALLGERDGAATTVWHRLGVDRDRLVERLRPRGTYRPGAPVVRLDATARALWERARRTALLTGADRVGTRHLLLALVDDGPAAVVVAFTEAGVTRVAARAVLDRVPEIERLPARLGPVRRWRWRWARWRLRWDRLRRAVRRRPALVVALLALVAAVTVATLRYAS